MSQFTPKDINIFFGKLYEQVKKTAVLPAKKMLKSQKASQDNIILFVGAVYGHMIDAVTQYSNQQKKTYRIALLSDSKQKLDPKSEKQLNRIDIHLNCDTRSDKALQETLLPYKDDIVAVTCRPESDIPMFERVIPHLPYLLTPTIQSLRWSTDKIEMRERLSSFDTNLNPLFMIIRDESKKTIQEAEDKVGFPLIVKPAGMAASRLVTLCYHKEEFERVLKLIFRRVAGLYKETGGTGEPRVLIEQFMEGDMYSVDAYIDAKGKIYFCPMTFIKTGRAIGFDDFFGYMQITPTILKQENINNAQLVSAAAVYAVGLRNSSVHIELMRTELGWKIIEMGPRLGGFRHMMYEYAFGINHGMNDVLIRMGQKPVIPKSQKGYSVAMKFFAKKEGRLRALTGIKKAQELKSFKCIYVNKQIGDLCKYAKHGGSSVFNIIMFNNDRSELLADVRRLEQMVEIETE